MDRWNWDQALKPTKTKPPVDEYTLADDYEIFILAGELTRGVTRVAFVESWAS